MTNYSNGANFERKIKKDYEEIGWIVVRSAGSRGPIDLVAVHPLWGFELIQCKTRKPTKSEMLSLKEFTLKNDLTGYTTMIWPDGQERIK